MSGSHLFENGVELRVIHGEVPPILLFGITRELCTRLKDLWINALAVVTNTQPKLPLVIPDLNFDPRSLSMLEGIAHRLAHNAIDIEVPWCAFHIHTKIGSVRVPLICEFRAQHADRASEVVGNKRRGTQSPHRITTLSDRLPGLLSNIL